MTAVKFCGFTNKDDLAQAVALGVDAVGLVFYEPSPRYVSSSLAKQLVADIPAFVTVVALVVNMDAKALALLAKQVAFDIIQFHGDETADECQKLATQLGKRWIKAVRVGDFDSQETILQTLSVLKKAGASAALLDAYHPQQFGGTGCCFDWQKIPKHSPLPLILAGGLTGDNVAKAIAHTHVYGVDVSGGIEWQKGRKCTHLMANFIKQAKQ